MSQPSLELILEVNIFECLEQATNLTLGQLTQLRLKSRSEQVNLLFLAYSNRDIDVNTAQTISQKLGINVHSAPWISEDSVNQNVLHRPSYDQSYDSQAMHTSSVSSNPSSNPSSIGSGYSTRRRFSDRPSLTEAIQHANQHTNQPIIETKQRSKKRQFAEANHKTEIEINLPSLMEEMHTLPDPPTQTQQSLVSPSLTSSTVSDISYNQLADTSSAFRWSALSLHSSRSHLGVTIYKYALEDYLLKQKIFLTSVEPINDLDNLIQVDTLKTDCILTAYQSVSKALHYPILDVSMTHLGHLVYWRVKPQGQSLKTRLATVINHDKSAWVQHIFFSLVCKLAQVHQAGVVHRALDPASIYIRDNDIVIDSWEWSIKYQEGHFSTQTMTLGQPSAWSAPELLDYGQITGSDWIYTDIYSVGALLFWMLTGSVPPANIDIQREWLSQSLNNDPQVTQIIDSCLVALSPIPTDRPKTLEEFYQSAYGHLNSQY